MPKDKSYEKMSYEHELMGSAPAGKEMMYVNKKYGGKGVQPENMMNYYSKGNKGMKY